MRRSEFIEKLNRLVGDEDVEIYFDSSGEQTFTSFFKVILDGDGDIIIQP